MRALKIPRYGPLARFYDVLSFERAVYRAGRLAAIAQLALRPGDRVLDVGCGTGLNFALLVDAVGPTGEIVGVDVSTAMLTMAERRVARQRWPQVRLVEGTADDLAILIDGAFDAVLFTYSLAIVDEWRSVWRQALALLRPGGRVAVADTAPPTGRWRVLAPLAWLAMFTGGVHPARQVWQAVTGDTTDTSHSVLKGGHVHVGAGTARPVGARGAERSRHPQA